MDSSADTFDKHGYLLLPGLLPSHERAFLTEHFHNRYVAGDLNLGDTLVAEAPCAYADPAGEAILERLRPEIEKACRRKLFPTYSYLRIYRKGAILPRHRDRPACEISVTLSVDFESADPWSIWLDFGVGAVPISLRPGDGLLYKGTEVYHWREPFLGQWAIQLFLHYVDARGPHRDLRFDTRERLAVQRRA